MATRIPINSSTSTNDGLSFEDRQKQIWTDMERDMEKRRREWEGEIDKMRKEFFLMNPDSQQQRLPGTDFPGIEASDPVSRLPARVAEADDGKAIIEKDEQGNPMFKVRFNMKDYSPEEITVKMDTTKIMVSARHEEKGQGSSVSREYSREVNIPRDVDPLALQCTLNPDGHLEVHAPLPTPSYAAIKDPSAASSSPPGVVKSSSSYSTSSSSSSTLPKGASATNQIPPLSNPLPPFNTQMPSLNAQMPSLSTQMPSLSTQMPSLSSQMSSLNSQMSSLSNPILPADNIQMPPPPVYSQVEQQSQQQQQNVTVNQQAPQVSTVTISQSPAPSQQPPATNGVDHPDHVTKSFKPPPDLSKLDNKLGDEPTLPPPQFQTAPLNPILPTSQLSGTSSLPRQSPFESLNSTLNRSSPFESMNSTLNRSSPFESMNSTLSMPSPFESMNSTLNSNMSSLSRNSPFGSLNSTFPTGPMASAAQLSTPTVTSQDGKFQLTMPIDEYKPEELTVKTQDGKVIICAKRQFTTGNQNRTTEMNREHSLPDNVDPLTIKAFFTDTNNLIVEAPFIK